MNGIACRPGVVLGKEDRDAHHGEESGMLYYPSLLPYFAGSRHCHFGWFLGGLHFDVISFFPFGVEINY